MNVTADWPIPPSWRSQLHYAPVPHVFAPFSLTPLLVVTLYALAVQPLWPLLVFPPPKSRLSVAGHPLRGSAPVLLQTLLFHGRPLHDPPFASL